MPTLIESIGTRLAHSRLGDTLLANERRKMQDQFDTLLSAYFAGPWQLPPDELARQLAEVDPWQVWAQLDQMGWEVLAGTYMGGSTAERARAVRESRRLYRYNPLTQWSTWLWTSWGMGDRLEITVERDGAEAAEAESSDTAWRSDPQAAWDEFATDARNAALLGDDNVQELSNWLLVDGNQFLAFYTSDQDGETTITEIGQDEIAAIVTHPQYKRWPLFYKRQFQDGTQQRTWFYPDYEALLSGELDELYPGDPNGRTLAEMVLNPGDYRADLGRTMGGDEALGGEEKPHTVVCILHCAHNRKDRSSLWGWPLATCGYNWTNEHKRFAEARLTVAMSKAMFVRRKKVAGGSRAVKSVQAQLASTLSSTQAYDTNPPPAFGSVEVENRAVDTEDLPMMTGASDAKVDNDLFSWMTLLSYGLFPTSAGLDTSRWATALEMDKAQSMLFERYRTYWSAQFKKIVRIVLSMREQYGGAHYGDYTIEVSVDSFSLADVPGMAETVGTLLHNGLTPLVQNNVVSKDGAAVIAATLWRSVLRAFGAGDAQKLTSDEALGIRDEREESPTPPPAVPPGAEPPLGQGREPPPVGLAQVAATIGANLAAGDVELAQAMEWAVREAVEQVRGADA